MVLSESVSFVINISSLAGDVPKFGLIRKTNFERLMFSNQHGQINKQSNNFDSPTKFESFGTSKPVG